MTRFWRTLLLAGVFAGFHVAAWAEPVDINRADAATIASSLKGVGTKKAEAIVAFRDANGPFKSPDDLAQVKGIGPHTVDMNREDIRVETPAKKQ